MGKVSVGGGDGNGLGLISSGNVLYVRNPQVTDYSNQ